MAAAAVAAYALGAVGGTLHLATVGHVVCEAHGHVTHGEPGHEGGPRGDELVAMPPGAEDHAGCAVAAHLTEKSGALQASASPHVATLAPEAVVAWLPPAHASAPLTFAPKQSPPQV